MILTRDLGKKAAFSITALRRMSALANGAHDHNTNELQRNINGYKEESERVRCFRLPFPGVSLMFWFVGGHGRCASAAPSQRR